MPKRLISKCSLASYAIYVTVCWAIMKEHMYETSVVEMRMLEISKNISIEIRSERQLAQYDHIMKRLPIMLIRRCLYMEVSAEFRQRSRLLNLGSRW